MKAFYIICPDDDVSEELDQARMMWGANDAVEGRPALSRWCEEGGWQGKAEEWIKGEVEKRVARKQESNQGETN